MQAYCMKCRTKREMKDPKNITMKNGRPATQGICNMWNKDVQDRKGLRILFNGVNIEIKLVDEGFHILDPIISLHRVLTSNGKRIG